MKNIPDSVINRLPRYYRYLSELPVLGITRISSAELSGRMKVTASQIRQDLNHFGGFGQQGYGYNVVQLQQEIAAILGINPGYTAILVGAGNMGKALSGNDSLRRRGLNLIGIFDIDPKKIGGKVSGITVSDYADIKEFIAVNKPDIAILCVTKESVHDVASELIDFGITGFLNFTYTELSGDGICVENVHISDSIMKLSYKLTQAKTGGGV